MAKTMSPTRRLLLSAIGMKRQVFPVDLQEGHVGPVIPPDKRGVDLGSVIQMDVDLVRRFTGFGGNDMIVCQDVTVRRDDDARPEAIRNPPFKGLARLASLVRRFRHSVVAAEEILDRAAVRITHDLHNTGRGHRYHRRPGRIQDVGIAGQMWALRIRYGRFIKREGRFGGHGLLSLQATGTEERHGQENGPELMS
jgi:hypothetical protein